MKIVCDACQAKYSISDDKVQGKVFKIRCKKCSNIIVVRGGAGAAEAAPPPQEKDTRVYDYGYDGGDRAPAGDEAVWHVVINQDQVGPMTAVDVQRRFSSGEIDSETYVWREGFADWLPLAQVDTFASLASAGAAGAAARKPAEVSSMFGGAPEEGTGRSDPGDLFAAASASAARHDDDGGDLFGSKPASSPSAQGGASSKLRGERNENSVLFSLNNLAQLASDKPAAPVHAAQPAASVSAAPSSGEGSGLIDIRSMASAYLGGGTAASKPASAGVGSIDDLPVFGGGGFSEPAVIVPIAARSNNNKLMYALIGSVGVLAVAAVVVVVIFLTGSKRTEVASATKADTTEVKSADPTGAKPTDPNGAVSKPPESTTAPAKQDPAVSGSTGTGSAAATPTGSTQVKAPPATDNPPDKHSSTSTSPPPPTTHKSAPPSPPSTPSSGSTSTKPTKSDKVATTKADPAPPPPAKTGGDSSGCDEVSCVVNGDAPCCARFRKGGGGKAAPSSGGTTTAAASNLPASLDRDMISEGVGKVRGLVMSCSDKAQGATGQVKVSVKVGPDGHVTSVSVRNAPDGAGGAALGSCVSGMMQRATFAKTQTGGAFAYPFNF